MQPTEHTLGDTPIDERHREKMIAMARVLDTILNGPAKGEDRDITMPARCRGLEPMGSRGSKEQGLYSEESNLKIERHSPSSLMRSWYCDQCHVEVRERRCPHCGKTHRESK